MSHAINGVFKVGYNIIQRPGFAIIFLLFNFHAGAQSTSSNNTLAVMHTKALYQTVTAMDSNMRMVELQQFVPGIVLDLRYATKNNFMHRRMYPKKTNYTFLRLSAARALTEVQQELKSLGYGLKIWDAYRPYAVTVKFWKLVHDDRYVADPKKGSGHNRGIAVDLTLINLSDGSEVSMPTGFDNFSDTAHQNFMQLPDSILQHRDLLKRTMEKHGFLPFATEWWHYSLPNPTKYAVLDLDFKELETD